MSISNVTAPSSVSTPAASAANNSMSGTQDRFLKLLVAQLNNQDPMNPMDNAAMTSQIAQINTVTGIQQVNDTLKGMSMLQGSSMVGHDVLMPGNTLNINNGQVGGAVELASSATSVMVNILAPDRTVAGTVDLGARPAGQQHFEWDASKYTGKLPLTFEVAATNGKGAVSTTLLARDKVLSVGSDAGVMSVRLQGHNTVPYTSIKAIL